MSCHLVRGQRVDQDCRFRRHGLAFSHGPLPWNAFSKHVVGAMDPASWLRSAVKDAAPWIVAIAETVEFYGLVYAEERMRKQRRGRRSQTTAF